MKFREVDIKRIQHHRKLEEVKDIKKHLMKRYQELKKNTNDTNTKGQR